MKRCTIIVFVLIGSAILAGCFGEDEKTKAPKKDYWNSPCPYHIRISNRTPPRVKHANPIWKNFFDGHSLACLVQESGFR